MDQTVQCFLTLPANDNFSCTSRVTDKLLNMESDESVEFMMLEYTVEPGSRQHSYLRMEKTIVDYLKGLGLQFKTDPRQKRDLYWSRAQSAPKRLTTYFGFRNDMGVEGNVILRRRFDFASASSSPHIKLPPREKLEMAPQKKVCH